jgi:hypothetical protein
MCIGSKLVFEKAVLVSARTCDKDLHALVRHQLDW